MSVLEWKMFNFFKLSLDMDIKYKNEVTSFCNNSIYKIFCNACGEVQVLLKNCEWKQFQIAENDVFLCCIPENSDNLIILRQHSVSNQIFLKIYNISKQISSKTALLISNAILECNCSVTSLNAINIDTQLCIAIGLESGNILFYKLTLSKDISSNFKSFNVCSKAIKGIEFSRSNVDVVNMFLCSNVGVFCYTISNNLNLNESKLVLDDMVSSINCCTLKTPYEFSGDQYFIVARYDALYCYTVEGRGPCYAIKGHKQIVKWFGKNLIVVLRSTDSNKMDEGTTQLVIIDINNKMIVLKKELNNIVCIMPAADQTNCLIFLKDGRILTLIEHEVRYKLRHLIKKKLYDIAIKLLKDTNADSDILAEVVMNYGDHLLRRGDNIGAMKEYSETIGITPPFLIINRLMDFRYNEYLIQYLNKLVNTGHKLPEHVELLNNCCRRIDLPLKTSRVFATEKKPNNLYVDYSTIQRCEKIALFLETVHNNMPSYFFNDMGNTEVTDFFLEYGYWLMNNYPHEITAAVKYISINQFRQNSYLFYKIILPLLLMNKMCAIDFINNLNRDFKSNILFNIWTELILQMWQRGDVDINFVMDFLRLHTSQICIDNVFLICRNYRFWPGIRMMYDKCRIPITSMRCLVNCYEMFPMYINEFSDENISTSNQMWILNLSKQKLDSNYSLKFLGNILKKMIETDPYYILNILKHFFANNNFLLSHLNELFFQENLFNNFKCDNLYMTVSSMEKQVFHIKDSLNNYLSRPIEFRSRSCDYCKQVITQPVIYFMCQHSYHRECIRSYSDFLVCISCENIQKSKLNEINTMNNKCNKNCKLIVSEKIGQSVFKQYTNAASEKYLKKKILKTKSNPFELKNYANIEFQEYDANLNPFDET